MQIVFFFLIGAMCIYQDFNTGLGQIVEISSSHEANQNLQIFSDRGHFHNVTVHSCEEVAESNTTNTPITVQTEKTTEATTTKGQTACKENDASGDISDDCVPPCVLNLLDKSKYNKAPINDCYEVSEENDEYMTLKKLNHSMLPVFLEELKNVSVNITKSITKSPDTVSAIIKALSNITNTFSMPLNKESTKNILEIASLLTSNEAKESWDTLNQNEKIQSSGTKNDTNTKSSSSSLLNLFESVTTLLVNESFSIDTPFIQLRKTIFTNSFNENFNSSVEIDIQEVSGESKFITVIIFASMDNVLPPRDEANSSCMFINGKVALVKTEAQIRNISIRSEILNGTLMDPKCVFWDFKLFDGLGGWSKRGCSVLSISNEFINCSCNHTTSFSILMSPDSFKNPKMEDITFIGVGISIGSLVICLITEALIWKKISANTTAFVRHVSIVNIAVSLLIANIWFIIGSSFTEAQKKNPPACAAATFFIHFFYLAMFFWMLASGLLLLYRTIFVFERGLSQRSMLVIGFVLGYAAPLIIAVITVTVTAPLTKYMRGNHVCWLNWEDSKALLAFLVPALLIVAVNFIILLVVIYKMLRRAEKNAGQAGEQHVLMVIFRSLAVLTPFFGLTWSLGIGTLIAPKNREIHFAFALCNSLQGCFILLFGTLLDKKVRSETIKSLSSQDKSITG